MVRTAWILALALSAGCLSTPAVPPLTDPCTYQGNLFLTAGSSAEYIFDVKETALPMFSAPGHGIPWKALGITGENATVRIQIDSEEDAIVTTLGTTEDAIEISYFVLRAGTWVPFHNEWVSLVSGGVVSSQTFANQSIWDASSQPPARLGERSWYNADVPPLWGWTVSHREPHAPSRLVVTPYWMDPRTTGKPSQLGVPWIVNPNTFIQASEAKTTFSEKMIQYSPPNRETDKCLWFSTVNGPEEKPGPRLTSVFGNYSWPLATFFDAKPIKTYIAPGRPIPEFTARISSSTSDWKKQDFLLEFTAKLPTPFETALNAAKKDPNAGQWLRQHPLADLLALSHAKDGVPSQFLDEWQFFWEDQGETLHALVKRRSVDTSLPMLDGRFVIGAHEGHNHAQLQSRLQGIGWEPETLATTVRSLMGKDPQSFGCDFGQGWCFFLAGETFPEPETSDTLMADPWAAAKGDGLTLQLLEGRVLGFRG